MHGNICSVKKRAGTSCDITIKEPHGTLEEVLARRRSLRSHFRRQIFAVRLHHKFYEQTDIHEECRQ